MKSIHAGLLLLALAAAAGAEETASVSRRIDEAILRHGLGQFWGAVLVAREGKPVLARGYGLVGDSLAQIDADSLFEIASSSKSFTAAALAALEMDGKLSLDDPVAGCFPDLDTTGDITLRHLLNHTSGMSDRAGALQEYGFENRDKAVELAFGAPRDRRPGEAYEYCNAGYVVLAAVIEKASGEKFETYLRERILKPAGMTATGFVDGKGLDPARVTARRKPGTPGGRATACTFQWGWGYRGAGGIVTSLNDLLKWDRALAGEVLLSAKAKERMYTVGKGRYACGWNVEFTPRGTRKAHHSGGVAGYHCQIARFLEEDTFVAILTNEAWDPFAIEALIEAEIFPKEPEGLEVTIDRTALALDEWKNADFETKGGWSVTSDPKGGRILVTLAAPKAKKACLVLALTPAAATALVASLSNVVEDDTVAVEGASMSAMICTGSYESAGGSIVLPRGMKISAAPFYRGAALDRRPTLSIEDPAGGTLPGSTFFPVIVRMDPGAAAELLRDLRKALK
ncbi:MAG: beta-lactamase family protein [Planctomycetes bacterium]|nr:beta-lactamase family protein [Planctomycetota bacterium]